MAAAVVVTASMMAGMVTGAATSSTGGVSMTTDCATGAATSSTGGESTTTDCALQLV